MKRIGVLTSGGDAPGMNAAVRAVVRAGLARNISTVGFKRGFNGILMTSPSDQENFIMLTSREVSGVVQRGGTFLRTARCHAFFERENQEKAVENLRSLGIEALVCIGGDGTYHGAAALKELGFPVIGIPGTIDNDMSYSDYSIGFDTALDTAIENIDKIRDTCGAHERSSLVTVMGRNCGQIALSVALACGAEQVMAPEIPWTLEETAEKVKWAHINGKDSMIMIFAEGAIASLTSDLDAICSSDERLRSISKKHISSNDIARIIEVLSGHEVRATVLGYTQRGGNPSTRDRIAAARLGEYAVRLLNEGISGVAVGFQGDDLIYVPVEEAMSGSMTQKDALQVRDLIYTLSGL